MDSKERRTQKNQIHDRIHRPEKHPDADAIRRFRETPYYFQSKSR